MNRDINVTMRHESNGCVISLIGPIDIKTMRLLAEQMLRAIEYYQYRHVVLQIDSEGGSLAAVGWFEGCLAEWRKRYPEFVLATQSLTQALDAAAVLLALGNVGHRSASRFCRLAFHASSLEADQITLTAKRALALADAIRLNDEVIFGCLRTHIGLATDDPVLTHWRYLMEHPTIVSPQDFIDLKLIDTIENGYLREQVPASAPVKSVSPRQSTPCVLSGYEAIAPFAQLSSKDFLRMVFRHVLITGETGSGKTQSGIFPFLHALHAQDNVSALVIDPKKELLPVFRAKKDAHPVVVLGHKGTRVRLFQDISPTDPEAILERIETICPSMDKSNIKDPYWITAARELLRDMLALFASILADAKGISSEEDALSRIRTYVRHLWSDNSKSYIGKGIFDDASDDDDHRYSASDFIAVFTAKAGSLLEYAVRLCSHQRFLRRVATTGKPFFTSFLRLPDNTFGCVAGICSTMLSLCFNEHFTRAADISLYPGKDSIDITVDMLKSGTWYFFQPESLHEGSSATGRLVKSLFFTALFKRNIHAKNAPFVYCADEAQRFVTADPYTGEQSVLDRARAYSCGCILATQSLASLEYAVMARGDSTLAVRLMAINSGTRLFFRTKDDVTEGFLKTQIPVRPGFEHVMQVRPLSQLRDGECLYMVPGGGWGRAQIAWGDQR